MAGGVVDGQLANQTIFNAAFLHKNAADTMPYILGLSAASAVSGPAISDVQLTINNLIGGGSAPSGVKSNVLTLGSGVAAATVTFTSAFPSSAYSPIFSFENTTGATPLIILSGIVTQKLTTGFVVHLNTSTPATGYKMPWSAIIQNDF